MESGSCVGHIQTRHLLGLPLVSGWSKPITSRPSKLSRMESGAFSPLQCYIGNCQQTLIQSLVKSYHPEMNPASDGYFPRQCCGRPITGPLISLQRLVAVEWARSCGTGTLPARHFLLRPPLLSRPFRISTQIFSWLRLLKSQEWAVDCGLETIHANACLFMIQDVSVTYCHSLLTGKSPFYKSEHLSKINVDNRGWRFIFRTLT